MESVNVFMTYRAADVGKLPKRLFEEADMVEKDDDGVAFHFYDTTRFEAEDYFVPGCPSHGYHGALVGVDPHAMFSDGEEFGEIKIDEEGNPVVPVPEDHDPREPLVIRDCDRRMLDLYSRARDLVSGKLEKPA